MVVPGKQSKMSHANMKCEVCHTQAQQQCWNCHVEESNTITSLPLLGTNDVNMALNLPFGVGPINGPIINVREAEGEPILTDEQNARLKELPAENDAAHISVVLTFPQSKNQYNKALKYLGKNNYGQVTSMVHCPGPPRGIKTQPRDPRPLNKDGGLIMTKSGEYGKEGAVSDITTAAEGAWFMEPGHSIARNPDGFGYDACYNCHADTVRLGQEPITYFRKQPWVMNTVGDPDAVLPATHLANNAGMIKNGTAWNCNCHGPAAVHNGTFDGPWPLHNTPEDEYTTPPVPGNCGNGAALYAANCQVCHGALSSSTKRGRTEEQIEAAISTQAAMARLKGKLTDAQLAEIACALSDGGSSSGGTTINGGQLYTDNCAACHGALATSAKKGATYARIAMAIANQSPMNQMASLKALTDDEIHAIAKALGGE
ncbi:MAG: hypothetical protein HGA78_04505 [Nitrospirales bacterium]|nr:hypothetical protein [Nitrospirales bacterium]